MNKSTLIGLTFYLMLKMTVSMDKFDKNEYGTCKDLSELRKENIFKEFDSLYRQYLNEVFYARGISQEPHVSRNMNFNLLRDKGQCFDFIQNRSMNKTQIENVSTCPWTYKIKKRTNVTMGFKYPTYRREAHCLCDSCQSVGNKGKNASSYHCLPILQAMTCLERSRQCDHEGFYKWIPSIEMISVGCVCAKEE